ncbi:MAG: HPr family phosphocarrier protein [Firmicutes bacterium]|nr:HPr family phosphocarrier protein [Bacillota bacterium]
MRSFMYTVKAPVGMHARHAGLLVREASRYASDIKLYRGERGADAKRVLGMMGLGVKQGDLLR